MRALNPSLLFAIALLPFALSAESVSEADRILGVWYTEKDEAKVEIYRDGEGYAGNLDLRGYIGVSLLGRTSMWRVAE